MKKLILIFCLAASSQAQVHLSFHDALQRALQVNNDVERSRAEVPVAEANRKYLLSQVLPRVNASGATIRNSENVTFGNGSDARTILPGTDWNYRLVLSQPVFAGLREKRAYEQAKIGVLIAREGILGTEDAVLLRVASNYLAIVDTDARIDIEKQNISLAQKRREQSDAFYQAGEVTKVDVLRAETAIKSAQRLLALAQQRRDQAMSRLRADLDLDGEITVDHPQQPVAPPPDEQTLVARAEQDRPDVAQAANNMKVARLEIQKQRGFWWPVVTFDAGYIQQKSSFPASSYGYGAFRFNVPIFQAGEVQARVAQARERELQSKLALESAKVNAREDVRTAFSDLRATETSLQLSKEQLAAAEAEYSQAFELYRAQETTSLDLAASETALADARRTVAEETLNHELSELRAWYAAGALKDAVGVQR